MGQDNLKVYITEFYKTLFGDPAKNNFILNESYIQDIPQLSREENDILVADITEKEVHEAISQMEKNKARDQMGSRLNFT